MKVRGVPILDTFAEAFPMWATRLILTACNHRWARHAARAATGFATSVIGCGCEAGVERELAASETPDGRPGAAVLLLAMGRKELARQTLARVGQCVLTSPGSACFSGLREGERLPLGRQLRYFGDGFQSSKQIGGIRYWRIPVMDGEFLCQEDAFMRKAVGGGNFLVMARDATAALLACEAATAAIAELPDVVTPFPGGVVRSGSKVGSKYPQLKASTNHAFCPTLRGQVESSLPPAVGSVLEVVIDGLSEDAVAQAMRAGIRAACRNGRLLGIGAGNYGGSLGPYHFPLRRLLQ